MDNIVYFSLDFYSANGIVSNMKPSDLVKWRKNKGHTQVSLAKELGVLPITIYRWEKAMREIPSFLHLALTALEGKAKKGGEAKTKGKKKMKKERG